MLRRFRAQWFGADGNKKTLQNAIVSNMLGKAVSIENSRPGDFVQFWRYSGSGHSVILVEWVRNNLQKIVGIKYWSTQSVSHGIGYRIEYFGGSQGIDPNQVYIARICSGR
jgi:hypothetical protein